MTTKTIAVRFDGATAKKGDRYTALYEDCKLTSSETYDDKGAENAALALCNNIFKDLEFNKEKAKALKTGGFWLSGKYFHTVTVEWETK